MRGRARRYCDGQASLSSPSSAAARSGQDGSRSELAAEQHDVGLAGLQDRLRVLRLGDQPHGTGRDAGAVADGGRERHLVAGRERDLLSGGEARPTSSRRGRRRAGRGVSRARRSRRATSRPRPSRWPRAGRTAAARRAMPRAPRRRPRARSGCARRSRRRSRPCGRSRAARGTRGSGSRARRAPRAAGNPRRARAARPRRRPRPQRRSRSRSARAARASRRRTPRRSARPAASRARPARAAAPPSHGAAFDALRPACAIWMPGTAPCSLRNAVIGRKAAACASDQMPESSGLMRPSGVTAEASTITAPAPPVARAPRWTRCHSDRHALARRVLAHRRDPDAVAELDVPEGDGGQQQGHVLRSRG